MNSSQGINPVNPTGSVSLLAQLVAQVNEFNRSTSEFQTLALAKFSALEARQEHFERSLNELRAAVLPPQRPPSPLVDIMTVDSVQATPARQDSVMLPTEVIAAPSVEKGNKRAEPEIDKIPSVEQKEDASTHTSKRRASKKKWTTVENTNNESADTSDEGVEFTSQPPQPLVPTAQIGFPKLKNFANTCHINSAINLVFQLPSLVKLVENEENRNPIKVALHDLYKVYRSGNEKIVNEELEKFVNVLVPNSKELQSNGQKDADVALRYILDALQYAAPYREAKYAFQTNRSRFVYRFENRNETVFAIQMTAKKLDEMFKNSFFTVYKNEDETMKWSPSAHDTPLKDWMRRTYFVQAPEVLFFNYLRGGTEGKKVLDNIPFEKEFSLPLHIENTPAQVAKSKEKIEENGQAKYRLSGVIMHLGRNMRGGHFCNYLHTDGAWYRVSDDASEVLSKLEDNSARVNEVSYILAYEKIPD